MSTQIGTSLGLSSSIPPKPSMAAYIRDLRQRGEPITFRLNGQAEILVQDDASLQRLLELVERLETVDGIREALGDIQEGRSMSFEEFKERVRQSHGISN